MHRSRDEGAAAPGRAGGHASGGTGIVARYPAIHHDSMAQTILLATTTAASALIARARRCSSCPGTSGSTFAEDVARSEGSFLPKPLAAADLRQALDGVSSLQEPRPPPDPAAGSAHSTE